MTEAGSTLYFDDISDLLMELGGHITAAELHGILTGQLCAGVRMEGPIWLKKALEFIDADQAPGIAAQKELLDLYEYTLQLLEQIDNIFYPLLPDDDSQLSVRIRALAQWCDGFLAGFALVEQPQSHEQFPVVISDALKDLAAVSRAGLDVDDEPVEEGEQDYMEIVEYVRMVAMNIYLELGVKEQALQDQAETSQSTQNLFNRPLH